MNAAALTAERAGGLAPGRPPLSARCPYPRASITGVLQRPGVRQRRRLGMPRMAPTIETPRVTTITPKVIQEPSVAARCVLAAAAKACCVARSTHARGW
jgi:hypothetical protein